MTDFVQAKHLAFNLMETRVINILCDEIQKI